MRTICALVLALVLTSCAPAGTAATASPTATATATVSATPTASATPAATTAAAATPSPSPIALPNSAIIAAAGSGVVWALVADTRLFRSTDRGDTWTERPLPSGVPVGGMAFVSDRDGWLLSVGSPATQCQSQSAPIYRTSDGATTWQRIDPQGIASAQCKEALVFNDTTHGYLSAWDPNSAPHIYRTTDGGTTYVISQPLADPPGFTTTVAGNTLRAAGVADFASASFVTAVGFISGREVDYIYRSTDRGASWSYLTTAPLAGLAPVFITPSRWLQISPGAVAQETTNGGASWHTYGADYSQAAPVPPQMVFGDANTGYATARGSIQRTIDGGLHWTHIATPGT